MITNADRNAALRKISVLAWLTERATKREDRMIRHMNALMDAMLYAQSIDVEQEQINTAVIYGLELAGLII